MRKLPLQRGDNLAVTSSVWIACARTACARSAFANSTTQSQKNVVTHFVMIASLNGKETSALPAAPPHSLHLLLRRWCGQMLAPPHSLQLLLSRWCWQMPAPPHSLHLTLRRWCGQRPAPPHCLHSLLLRWCGQTLRGFFCAAPSTASASPRRRRLPAALASASSAEHCRRALVARRAGHGPS
jgi:hypothetical protein